MIIKIAINSLFNRRTTVLMTVISIAVSVALLLGVDHIRREVKNGFMNTVSGVDLVVGARTSQINLLLYSIFRIGNATNNISWKSFQELSQHPQVSWTIPISLGDSHRGYRVMGTNKDYFKYYRFSGKQLLKLQQGKEFDGVYETVLGAEVAKTLGHKLNDHIVLAHGIGSTSFTKHKDKPFRVVGILKPTGTPVDQTVHINLAGLEAIHIDWQQGVQRPGFTISAEDALKKDLTPHTITAFMVGLDSKIMTFSYQRFINDYKQEPLLGILPGVALTELWQMMSMIEQVLILVSFLVLIASLIGLSTMLLASIKQRQREIAILRAVGAPALMVILLIELEAVVVTLLGMIVGAVVVTLTLLLCQSFFVENYGLFISAIPFNEESLKLCWIILGLTLILAFIPALFAYRDTLTHGLTVQQ